MSQVNHFDLAIIGSGGIPALDWQVSQDSPYINLGAVNSPTIQKTGGFCHRFYKDGLNCPYLRFVACSWMFFGQQGVNQFGDLIQGFSKHYLRKLIVCRVSKDMSFELNDLA